MWCLASYSSWRNRLSQSDPGQVFFVEQQGLVRSALSWGGSPPVRLSAQRWDLKMALPGGSEDCWGDGQSWIRGHKPFGGGLLYLGSVAGRTHVEPDPGPSTGANSGDSILWKYGLMRKACGRLMPVCLNSWILLKNLLMKEGREMPLQERNKRWALIGEIHDHTLAGSDQRL